MDASNADAHFDAAIGQLVRLQSIRAPGDMPVFGEALLQRDAGLFEQWFLHRHLGLELDCGDAERLQLAQRRLMDNALAQARVTSAVSASPFGPSSMRTTAASPPGFCNVLPRMR